MGAFYISALNSLLILAQSVIGIVILIPDSDLIKLGKSCTPDIPATITQSSVIILISRCRLK